MHLLALSFTIPHNLPAKVSALQSKLQTVEAHHWTILPGRFAALIAHRHPLCFVLLTRRLCRVNSFSTPFSLPPISPTLTSTQGKPLPQQLSTCHWLHLNQVKLLHWLSERPPKHLGDSSLESRQASVSKDKVCGILIQFHQD